MIFATIKISGVGEAEQAAKEILAHIDAIRDIQARSRMHGISVELDLDESEETASCN